MPVDTQDFVEVICVLAEEENVQITVRESVKGGIVAGISAVTGGIIFGPIGLAIGGTIGGCLAAYLAQGKFKCVAEIIHHMNHEEKQKLVDAVSRVVDNVEIQDMAKLAALMAGDVTLRGRVLEALIMYLRNEMQMEIID